MTSDVAAPRFRGGAWRSIVPAALVVAVIALARLALETPAAMEFALPLHWPLIVSGGFVVGLLIGLTGVGAGSLTTPFLISAIGVNPLIAVGTDLLFACITKASAAYRHFSLGNVNTRILMWLSAGSLPAAAMVFSWLAYTEQDVALLGKHIRQILSVILIVSALAIILYPLAAKSGKRAAGEAEPGVQSRAHRPGMTLMLGLVLGTAVALTSIGAGAIGVVALTALFPALAIRRLVGTDIVHAIPLTLVAGLGHLRLGNVDAALLLTLLAGSIPGIAIGSRLTGSLPDWALRWALAAMLVFAAFAVVMK